MTVRRLAHGVAASLATVVLLGGCSDDPDPRFSEPTESPTPSGSATTPADPEQTAEEFIREWVALDTTMQNTGETDDYLEVSNACTPCRAVAARVERAFAHGGYIETDGWSISRIKKVAGPGRYRLNGTASMVTIVERKGAEEDRLPGGPISYEIVLRRDHNGWQVRDVLEVAS